MSSTYVPGVCNIGPAEIRRRQASGWLGLGLTIIVWVVLALTHTAPAWRLFVFLPASIGASGFLQAALHFCARFGFSGLYNFGATVGKTDTVEQAEFRKKDQAKARLIGGLAGLIGAVVAFVAYVFPPM